MSKPEGWRSSAGAARMRDVIVRIATAVVERERPPYRYGTVESIDLASLTCNVVLAGDTGSVPVRLYMQRPSVGQSVRVCGMRGDRYVDAIVATGESVETPDLAGWTSLDTLPFSMFGGCAVAVGDVIYLIGGFRDFLNSTELQAYEPDSGDLADLASMPVGCVVAACHASIDNRFIYVAGGYDGSDVEGTLDEWSSTNFMRYEIATDTWVVLEDLPVPTWGGVIFESFIDEDTVELIHLSSGDSSVNTYKYTGSVSTATGSWETLSTPSDPPALSMMMGGNLLEDDLWHIAGQGMEPPPPTNQFTWNGDDELWAEVASSEPDHGVIPSVCAGRGGSKLYVLGGGTVDFTATSDVACVYDALTEGWMTAPAMPEGRYLGAAVKTATKGLFVFGGVDTFAEVPSGTSTVYRITEI